LKGERRAGTAAEKIDFFDQLLFADDGAAQDAALAVDPFGRRMHDQVCAVLNGCLSDGVAKQLSTLKISWCRRANSPAT